jgi:hypothetical protein
MASSRTSRDDHLAVAFSRGVTRRRFLQRTMTWGFAAGTALSTTSFFVGRRAQAANCSNYGT